MRIEHLKEFVTLGHTCSFGATAKLHYVTEATLSKHVAAIEAEVGAKLLIRDTRHVRLSRVGREFLQDVEGLVEEYDYAMARAKALAASTCLLRVGFLSDACGGLLPKTLKWMGERHPEMNVQLTSTDFSALASGLVARRYNLILTMDADHELARRCHVMKLHEDELCAAVSLDHPLAGREAVGIDEMAAYPLLLPDALQMSPLHQRMLEVLDRPLDECSVAKVCYDMSSIILLAEVGIGVGMAPRFMERQYRGRMRFVPLVGSPAVRLSIGAFWLKGKDEDLVAPLVAAFGDVVQGRA